MTPDEERKFGLMRELRHRWKAFDACAATDAARVDIQKHIRRCEAELSLFGTTSAEVVAFDLREDRREQRARKMIRDASYARSGLIVSEW